MATDAVFRRVRAGQSFRDAYREVARDLEKLDRTPVEPESVIRDRTATGTPGNPGIDIQKGRLQQSESELATELGRVRDVIEGLAGKPLELFTRTDF
jgi:argininosuccinate lyase